MRNWALFLGGLLVWAAHFFLLFAFASIFPGEDAARWLTIAVTVPASAANAMIFWFAASGRVQYQPGQLDRLVLDGAAAGSALSLIAVVWQALPAIL